MASYKKYSFLTSATATLMMSFFLFQLLNIIFHPLRQISSVAHNFNLMAEQIENQIKQLEDASEQKQQFVMSEYNRLQNMAYQLLDMALLRRNEMQDSDCSMKELFTKSKKIMHVRASKKKIRLTYVLSQNYIVKGNMEQLLILINNLIDNAIKASRQEDEIHISAYSEKAAIVVEVEDHGTGMEKAQISHIKKAFYRIDKARSRAAGGTGLGLAICEKIMQIHHAKMSFTSEPGAGTIVRLSFPVE